MPQLNYALEEGGEKRLNLNWKRGYKNMVVTLDGQQIGIIPNQKALKEGETFTLPDGSKLIVSLDQNFITGKKLMVWRNNKPLPGSASSAENRLKGAYQIIYFVGVVSLLLGLVVTVLDVQFLQDIGISFLDAIIGVVFLGLGYLVSKRVLLALYAAMGLYALLSILSVIAAVSYGTNPVGGVIVRLIFLAGMYQGIGAIQELNEENA